MQNIKNIPIYQVQNRKINGFSLVEISIVLLIVGLLAVAMIAGTSLLKSAKLQSIVTDIYMLEKAITDFKHQYSYYPGDFPNAGSTWSDSDCPDDVMPDGCNGNGDGVVADQATPADGYEVAHVMQHLSLAGLISGSYTATPADANSYYTSKFTPGLFSFRSFTSDNPVFGVVGDAIEFGALDPTVNMPGYAILSPADAQTLDSKIDDGVANSGRLFAIDADDISGSGGCSDSSSSSQGANYDLTYNIPTCTIIYWLEKF